MPAIDSREACVIGSPQSLIISTTEMLIVVVFSRVTEKVTVALTPPYTLHQVGM